MKLSFSLPKTSPQVLPGLKYFEKSFFQNFDRKKGLILLSQHTAFENGHTKESINLIISDSINLFRLHIIRQKEDCTFRSFILNILKFCQSCKILSYCWVALF